MSNVKKLIGELDTLVHAKDFRAKASKIQDLVVQIKIALIDVNLTPPFSGDAKKTQEDLHMARLALELSAFFAVKMEDFESFRHHMNQLKVYYFDYASLLKESNLQNHLLGLHLMSLLTSGDFSEFHVELERIPYEKHDNPFISFPLSIEQEMMEGSYHRIVTSVRKLPAEETYKVFMKKILHTVREKIAECAEKSYATLPIADAQQVLLFSNANEVQEYAKVKGWTLEGSQIIFPKGQSHSLDIPNYRVMEQNVSYAVELERII